MKLPTSTIIYLEIVSVSYMYINKSPNLQNYLFTHCLQIMNK